MPPLRPGYRPDENAAINLKHYGEERLGKKRDVA